MNLDYPALRLLWWALLVLAVVCLVLAESLMLGVTMLLPQTGDEPARRRILADLGDVAAGLQAWLPTLAVLLFAAWPVAYAVLFASLQPLLLAMIPAWLLRLAGLCCRNEFAAGAWRQRWDRLLHYTGWLLAALLGVICGNLLKGMPFHFDNDMRIFFLGDVRSLLNPFALLMAATTTASCLLYGACYLQLRHTGEVAAAGTAWVYKAGAAFLLLFVITDLWVSRLEGYHVTTAIVEHAPSNPLSKFVKRGDGLWLDNYEHVPELAIVPVLAFLAAAGALLLTWLQRRYWAFLAATLGMVFATLTVAVSMFPFLLPSNRSLNSSLTLWDASASQAALAGLAWPTAVALPLLALLTRWSFRRVGRCAAG